MLIDVHTHISTSLCPVFADRMGWKPFTADLLLQQMDRDGIDQSAVLPLDSPEAHPHPIAGTLETIEVCRRHPDRLLPFCNVDPRMMGGHPGADLAKALLAFKECGCRGVGEVCANLPIVHPLYQNLFRHAGALKMPILFHFLGRIGGSYGVMDEPGLTGLEQMLQAFPDTVFIGHGPAFWAEIAASVNPAERDGYPKGPILQAGRLCDLLTRYRNLYADISAGSGYNAVSRDPGFGFAFLEKHSSQILFGTDRFPYANTPTPAIMPFLRNACDTGQLSREAYARISHLNSTRLCGTGGTT